MPRPATTDTFDSGRALLGYQEQDPRPRLLLWTHFVHEMFSQVGGLVTSLRQAMSKRADEVHKYFTQEPNGWLSRAQYWDGIALTLTEPTTMNLTARNGKSIHVEFRMGHGAVEFDWVGLPPDVHRVPEFGATPRTVGEARAMASAKAHDFVEMLKRHIDPIAEMESRIQADAAKHARYQHALRGVMRPLSRS